MFEDQKSPPAGSALAGGPADDMFAGMDASSATAPGAVKPLTPAEKPPIFQPKVPAAPAGALTEETPANYKKYLVLGGLVLGMAVIVVGGWYGYKKFKGSKTDAGQTAEQPAGDQAAGDQAALPDEEQKIAEPAGGQAATGGSQAATDPTVTATGAPDSDDDGLSDEEEVRLGTNARSVDSDNDGLFDYEEVKVYGSDPLKADTDGDGFSDGQEVKGGYNPLGTGKLFDNKAVK